LRGILGSSSKRAKGQYGPRVSSDGYAQGAIGVQMRPRGRSGADVGHRLDPGGHVRRVVFCAEGPASRVAQASASVAPIGATTPAMRSAAVAKPSPTPARRM
jgi:hypothetical protein